MLNKIIFKNYKRFNEEQVLELRPVTVLVGRNSSGKSSVAKLLPLLANATKNNLNTPILFNNDGITVGSSFADVGTNGDMLGLKLGMEFSNGCKIEAELSSDATGQIITINNYLLDYLNNTTILGINEERNAYYNNDNRDVVYGFGSFRGLLNLDLIDKAGLPLSDFIINVDYIGPFRCKPERIVNSKGKDSDAKVGYDGSNAYQLLCHDKKLANMVSDWYKSAFEGCTLKAELVTELLGAYQINLYKSNSSHPVNIIDEGQGMSQVLPIIVRANMEVENSIVVMEQPELHLHPRAHADIAYLLASSSKKKNEEGEPLNQHYLVETHSENILLGLRNAVVDKNIDFEPEDVIIYFVQERENGTSWLKSITINDKGELSSWPKGVFNESYELLKSVQIKANS